MIAGIISDTHGNLALMHEVVDCITAKHGADLLIHVGDNYTDAQDLAAAGHAVRMVPGLSCDAYLDRRVPNTMILPIDGITIAAAHAEKDLGARELAATIVVTGHTHIATIEKLGLSVHVNPGHLKHPRLDRGQRPSYAIIEIRPDSIDISIHELDGSVRQSAGYRRSELA